MFNPSRDQVREFFFEVWRKGCARLPLTPLEDLAWSLVGEHPEYHRVLADREASLKRDWSPEGGETNPFLHLSLHLSVREQLSIDQPPGLRAAWDALRASGRAPHDCEHQLVDALAEAIWQGQRAGGPPDGAAYLARVRALAGLAPSPRH